MIWVRGVEYGTAAQLAARLGPDVTVATISAADLPDNSVIAEDSIAYVKNHPTKTAQWRGTNGGYFSNRYLDEYVLAAGGRVLRVGGPPVISPDAAEALS